MKNPLQWSVAALFAGTLGLSQAAHPVAAPVLMLESIPMTLAYWSGRPAPPLSADVARVLRADQYVHRYYTMPNGPELEMDVAYYAQPHVGGTAHSPLNCLPGNGWTMGQPSISPVRTADGTANVREVTVTRGSDRWGMAYWFQRRDRIDFDEFSARWHLFADALGRRPADTTLVRVMMPLTQVNATAHEELAAFAGALIPQVDRALSPTAP